MSFGKLAADDGVFEQRQALIEKNLSGVYSDEIFRDQNRIIEEKIAMINISKSDAIITKYNLERITNFVKKKFENLADTFDDSLPEQQKVLVCSIFPSGVPWGQKGLSNTKMSPYFSGILGIEDKNVQFGGPQEKIHEIWRTEDSVSSVWGLSVDG